MTRYPYEAGTPVNAFVGGFFDQREWPLRKNMEKQESLRAIDSYEDKYIKIAGYWGAFHESAI